MAKGIVFGGLNASGGSVIKSIQRGVSTIPANQSLLNLTINNFDPSKSVIIVNQDGGSSSYAVSKMIRAEIIDSTTIRFARNSSDANTIAVSWQVVEFSNVKSMQRGLINIPQNNGIAYSVGINAVDRSKSMLVFSFLNDNNDSISNSYLLMGEINSSTSFLLYPRKGNYGVAWQLIEFN